jgi:hypothetical protein
MSNFNIAIQKLREKQKYTEEKYFKKRQFRNYCILLIILNLIIYCLIKSNFILNDLLNVSIVASIYSFIFMVIIIKFIK